MRILIDITHPAHLHFFKHAIGRLRGRGHEVRLTARDKDILRSLGEELGIPMQFFGAAPPGWGGMARTLVERKIKLAGIIHKFGPDVLAALGGTFVGLVGRVTGVPSVVFYDTESAALSNRITFPFASRVCTPRCYLHNVRRQVRYAGYHELAYLSPDVFTPDPAVRGELGVGDDEPYCIARFVGWGASHDVGRRGLSAQQKVEAVGRLGRVGRVFISSEGPLPAELEPRRYRLKVSRMHDAIAQASLVIGESSTMCSEAAVLGTPSVFVYPRVELGYTREQAERWRIVHWFGPEQFDSAVDRAEQILRKGDRAHWRSIGKAIVADSVDVTEFICDQILATADGRIPSA